MIKLEIDDERKAILSVWEKEQNEIAIAQQKEYFLKKDPKVMKVAEEFCWSKGIPYTVTRHHLTYRFTPTSMGDVLIVSHAITGAELDLSLVGDEEW